MRTARFLAPLLLLAACVDGGHDEQPDADASTAGVCNPEDVRAERTAEVSGQVIDFVTLDSIDDALVEFTTAWDTSTIAPAEECGVIDAFRTRDDGRFGPATLEVGSLLTPPIALYQVSQAGRAPTASDQTMTCQDGTECLSPDHLIRAVSTELGARWRAELTDRGVAYADTRGLVLFEFREEDGTPAAGVTAILDDSDEALVPGVEVHYLTADRGALAPAATSATTESGVALLAVPAPYDAVAVGGSRGDDETWDNVGVLVMEGWFFLEDQRRSSP